MNGGDKFNRISCISRPFQKGLFRPSPTSVLLFAGTAKVCSIRHEFQVRNPFQWPIVESTAIEEPERCHVVRYVKTRLWRCL